MPQQILKQSEAAIWIQSDGPFNPASPFQRGQAGLGDITLPGPGDRTVFYGTDAFGFPVPFGFERSAPGQPSTSIENYITEFRDEVQKMRSLGQTRFVQLRFTECGDLDHPGLWDMVIHLGQGQTGDATVGASAQREYGDGRVEQAHPFNPLYDIVWYAQSLTSLTTTEAEAANGITFLSDKAENCGSGYPGPDKIGYIACDGGAATANILSTADGGSTWTVCSTDPFLTIAESADFPVIRMLNKTQFRVVVARIVTDAGNAAEIGYSDFSFGAEATSVWVNVDVGATNGETITALSWPEFGRMYAASSGGDVYLSTDQAVTWTLIGGDGTNDVNVIKRAPNGNTYFAGDANVLFVEKGNSSILETLVGPTGSDASFAIGISNIGELWLGNGTSLFYSQAALPDQAGLWTSSKSFGANHRVEELSLKGAERALGGESQMLHVVVNDTTGNEGDIWITLDGGGYWQEISNLANAGYNGAYFSPVDDNLGFIVGETVSSLAVIQKLSPGGGV